MMTILRKRRTLIFTFLLFCSGFILTESARGIDSDFLVNSLELFKQPTDSTLSLDPNYRFMDHREPPRTGWFASYERLMWSVQEPGGGPVGSDTIWISLDNDATAFGPPYDYYDGTQHLVLTTGTLPGPLQDPDSVEMPPSSQAQQTNTALFDSQIAWGSRFQLGRMGDKHGWMVDLDMVNGGQDVVLGYATMAFNGGQSTDGWAYPYIMANRLVQAAAGGGVEETNNILNTEVGAGLPVLNPLQEIPYYGLNLYNEVDFWNVNLNYLRRTDAGLWGGVFELSAGVNYLEFNETYGFEGISYDSRDPASLTDIYNALWQDADGNPLPYPNPLSSQYGVLAYTNVKTEAMNHYVGGKFGVRWSRRSERWQISASGHYSILDNIVTLRQSGNLDSALYYPAVTNISTGATPRADAFNTYREGKNVSNKDSYHQLSHIVNLRFDIRYQATKYIDITAGWTGVWFSDVARASVCTDYAFPMGVHLETDMMFMHGLSIGVCMNR